MLARDLQLALLAQVALGGLLAAWLLPAGSGEWLAALLVALATPLVLTVVALAVEIAVGHLTDRQHPPAGVGTLLRVLLSESVVSVRAFGWRQPFRSRFPEPRLVHDPARPAVLLVHGYLCNRAVWTPLLDSGMLGDANVATVNLEPVRAPIDRYGSVIDAAVRRLQDATGAARVTLVCHSMGGLAARVYLRDHGDDAVERVVTLATPHVGTVLARLGLGANARQMVPGTPFLRTLEAATTDAQRARFACVASADDNLIVPRASPLLRGARRSEVLRGVGHLAMIEDPRAWAIVADELAQVRAALAGAPVPATHRGGAERAALARAAG